MNRMHWAWWILIVYSSIGMVIFTYYEIYHREINERERAWIDNRLKLLVKLYIVRPVVFATLWIVIPIYKCGEIPFIKRRLDARRAQKELKTFINEPRIEIDYSVLTHERMGGAGDIICKDCFHKEHIISFLHGFGPNRWTKTGYQCQSCGKFHSIVNDHKVDPFPTCECGGQLSRDEVLFCPKCRSTNLEYEWQYMT